VELVKPFSVLFSFTVMSGRTAPVESVTVPLIAPLVVLCASSMPGSRAMSAIKISGLVGFSRMGWSPVLAVANAFASPRVVAHEG